MDTTNLDKTNESSKTSSSLTIVGDISSNSSLLDENINNSSTSDDSGIFINSHLGTDSAAQTPNTSPTRRPIYAIEKKEDRALGETLMKPQNQSKNNSVVDKSSSRTISTPSSPSSTSSDDSSMLDMISRAAIYDEIYKLDD